MDSLSDTLAHMTLEDEPETWIPYDLDGLAPWHYDPPVYSEWHGNLLKRERERERERER